MYVKIREIERFLGEMNIVTCCCRLCTLKFTRVRSRSPLRGKNASFSARRICDSCTSHAIARLKKAHCCPTQGKATCDMQILIE
jgi:hypothetical protein